MTSTKTKKQKKQTRKAEALERAREAYKRTMQALEHADELEDPEQGRGDFVEAYKDLSQAVADYVLENPNTDPTKLYKEIKGVK